MGDRVVWRWGYVFHSKVEAISFKNLKLISERYIYCFPDIGKSMIIQLIVTFWRISI